MRHIVARPASKATVRILAAFTAAALLSGCSGSIDRLVSWRGKNPSDADPVYTAALPKTKLTREAVGAPDADRISSQPIAGSTPKWKKFDYAGARKKPKLLFNNDPAIDDQPQDVAVADQNDDTAPVVRAKGGKLRVERGMTLYGIASANNVSIRKLAKANGIRAPYEIQVGQVLQIPGRSSVAVPRTTLASQKRQQDNAVAAATPVISRKSSGGTYDVQAGDTIFSIARAHGLRPAQVAEANDLTMKSKLSLGQSLKIPGASVASNEDRGSEDVTTQQVAANDAAVTEGKLNKLPASVKDVPEIPAVGEAPTVAVDKVETKPADVTDVADAGPGANLRWPLRGKVISEFGKKPDGAKNEGINIAVPEGTSVRAAETGVVAYAGNELKGYGNLVLIRHEGGYVTAYAHAKELMVKKGDSVKRGDVIAKAGQTGAVTSPQLHFEVRKGATAMDPLKFLGNSTAAN